MEFYGAVFGWTFSQMGDQPYWLIITGQDGTPGINGGLQPRPAPAQGEGHGTNAYTCTMDVASLDDSLATVLELGGREALPKMAIPGVGWLAYALDTEGNVFGMMQSDTTAA